jgi:hypothetical protein
MFLALLLVCLTSSLAAALGWSAAHDLLWWTVDGGGGTLAEGAYTLSGTIGQPEAGAALEEGAYTLVGGYWYGAGEDVEHYELYLPTVIR